MLGRPRRPRKPKNFSSSHSILTSDGNAIIPYTNTRMLVPSNAKYVRIPDGKLEEFLSYKSDGDSDSKAARLIGVDLRAIHYWLREDQRFADAYHDAMHHAVDANEDRVMDQCREGNIAALRMHLEAMRPARWARHTSLIEKVDNRVQNTLNINMDDEKQRIIDEMPNMIIENMSEPKNETTKGDSHQEIEGDAAGGSDS